MPYFIRRPYAATAGQAEPAVMPDVVALAGEVLALETGAPGASPFRVRNPLRPGTTGRLVLGLTADQAPVATRMSVTDLHGSDGVIPSSCLAFDPPDLTIPSGQSRDVTVSCAVPEGVKPGLYRGWITAAGANGFRAPVEVTVAP